MPSRESDLKRGLLNAATVFCHFLSLPGLLFLRF